MLPFCLSRLVMRRLAQPKSPGAPSGAEPAPSRCSTFARLVARQVDLVAAQRLRRLASAFGHYSRLWESERLRHLLRRVAWRALHQHRRILLGLAVLARSPSKLLAEAPDQGEDGHNLHRDHEHWTGRKLPDSYLQNHLHDVDLAHTLTMQTLTCPRCGKRLRVSGEVEGVDYCACADGSGSRYGVRTGDVPWTPFLEKPDILVWRQEHPENPGMFIYKMYGKFDDVTPCEYLQVQLDLSAFRMSWDQNAAHCRVIEQDLDEKNRSLSQIYYWEVTWPRFFSNRDYVCNRRSKIFSDDNVAVIYSKACTHPGAPLNDRNVRVEDYWSILSLKPTTAWNAKGLEFSLTAYENPGVSLPASVTTWVAMRGMPEFMQHLRDACHDLRQWKEDHGATEGDAEVADPVAILKLRLPHRLHEEIMDYSQQHSPSEVSGGARSGGPFWAKTAAAGPGVGRRMGGAGANVGKEQQQGQQQSRGGKYAFANVSI